MNVNVEKLENSQVKLTITVDAEKFDEGMNKAFFKNAKYFSVPGFRKGKAPRNRVEKYYGEQVLYEDAFNEVAPEVYDLAITENNIEAVARPEIDIKQIGNGKELIFEAIVTVKPEVELGEYKGITLEKKEYPVTDEDVDNAMKAMAEKNVRVITCDDDKIIENGDTAVIDFEGFVDGKAFDGGKGENYSLEIGSNTFIPGFEDQLIGLKKGEETEVNVTFPENYFSKELAGMPAIFKVKINEIKTKEYPEMDDEFAKDVSEFDTLKELKEDTREHLEEENAKKAKYETEEAAINAVIENTKIDIPRAMLDSEIDGYVQDMDNNLKRQGLSLDQYMKMLNMDMETVRGQYEDRAEHNILSRLVLEAIFKKENIAITDEDITNKLKDVAKEYGRDAEEFASKANDQVKEFAKEELKYDLAVKFIVDNAKIEGAKKATKKSTKPAKAEKAEKTEPASEEKPAKKTTKTKTTKAKKEE